jgi:hypothetical protein
VSNEELSRFFDFMWGTQEGVVYLPTKSPDSKWTKVFYTWPKDRNWIIKHVIANTATGKDVYFSPAIFSVDAKKNLSAEREYVLGSNVLWIDFDGNAPETWDRTPESQEASSSDPVPSQGHMGPPSLRVQTSETGREHVYWRLDEFNNDIATIEQLNRSLAYRYQADLSGWDANQVLRPIGTTNYKRNLPVISIEETDLRYRPSDFAGVESIKQLVAATVNEKELTPLNQIFGKYDWDTESLDLANKTVEDLGSRDRSAAMMRMAYRGAELGLSDQEIFSLLMYLDDKWGKFKNRDDRLKRMVEYVNRARLKHPHSLVSEIPVDAPVEDAPKIIMGFETFIHINYKIDWAIENLVAVPSVSLICSEPGVGKTQMMMNLAMHSALAKPFIGWLPTRRQKSIFFSLEMGPSKLGHFAREMAGAYNEDEVQILERNFLVAPIGSAINLHGVEGRGFIESLLDEYRPDAIYIDSLQRVLVKDLSDDEHVRAFFAYVESLTSRYGIHCFLVHHNRKRQGDNKKPVNLADVYGSQFITALCDGVFTLWEDREKKEIEVYNPKNRMGEALDPFKIKRVEHLQFIKLSKEERTQSIDDKLREGSPLGEGPSFKFNF